MKKLLVACLAVLPLLSAGSLMAHHSLANFDTTTAVRVKGTIVEIRKINPHSFIFLDETNADGTTQRWAVEGPALLHLTRSGLADVLKPGDVVEACGYLPKEKTIWQIADADGRGNSRSGRLLNAEVLVMPDGKEQNWGDYGFHRCFPAGYRDQHSR